MLMEYYFYFLTRPDVPKKLNTTYKQYAPIQAHYTANKNFASIVLYVLLCSTQIMTQSRMSPHYNNMDLFRPKLLKC
jgi:hypothetical protein